MLDSEEVLLRSEGYPTTGARDNGPASVQKNRGIKERYSTVEDNDMNISLLCSKPGIIKKLLTVITFEVLLPCCYISFLGTNAIAGKLGFPWGDCGVTGAAFIAHPVVMASKEKLKLITKQMINLNQRVSAGIALLSPPLL
jgi:hypothetical protein